MHFHAFYASKNAFMLILRICREFHVNFLPNLTFQNIANIVWYIVSNPKISCNIVWIPKKNIAHGWIVHLQRKTLFYGKWPVHQSMNAVRLFHVTKSVDQFNLIGSNTRPEAGNSANNVRWGKYQNNLEKSGLKLQGVSKKTEF